jgi:steroid delta-isomerase-like uncharacterized protein
MTTDRNETIRQFFAAFNAYDLHALARLFATDAVYTDVPMGRTWRGKDEILGFLSGVIRDSLDCRWDLDSIHGSGDRVATESFFSGGIPPGSARNPGTTVVRFDFKALTTFVLRDGLLADVTDYYNPPGT